MNDRLDDDVTVAPTQRFCGRCGAALYPEDAGCARCMQADADLEEQQSASPVADDRPSFKLAMVLFGVLLASFLPFMLIHLEDDTQFIYAIEHFVQVFDALLVLGFVAYCWQTMWPLFKTIPVNWCLAAIPTGVGTVTMALVFSWALLQVTGLVDESYYVVPAFEAGYGWTYLILSIVIQPAIIEELAFRGVIFDGVRKVLSDRETIIVTGLMFMVLHIAALGMFPVLLLMGLILGWLRLKTGSIWPCILLHATHNGLVLVYEYWMFYA